MSYLDIENSIEKEFYNTLYIPFCDAIKKYELIKDGDHICVCISGGKDSFIMAKLFEKHQKSNNINYKLTYLVMNPGYNEPNLKLIKNNIKLLNIDAHIIDTDIFKIANSQVKNACYLCAKMRRGALYRIAKEFSCNKIALGHHFDDVIVTTLMNMLNSGSFQTMIPKLHSKNFEGMELIRPMYLIKEDEIIRFKEYNNLNFLACACKFTESLLKEDNNKEKSQRLFIKLLIKKLKNEITNIEENLFKAVENVDLDAVVRYFKDGKTIENY